MAERKTTDDGGDGMSRAMDISSDVISADRAAGTAPVAPPTREAPSPTQARHVVVLLHGIRTSAPWMKQLAADLRSAGLIPEALSYGYFWAFQLLWPASRRQKVDWLREQLSQMHQRYSDAGLPEVTYSVIAHSFGTYMVARALEIFPEIKFRNVVFCGSIVPPDFPWLLLMGNGQVSRLLNEYGSLDFWARIVAHVVDDAGPAGLTGFTDQSALILQRRYPGFRHSDYFNHLHYGNAWIPFLQDRPLGAQAIEWCGAINEKFRRTKRRVLAIAVIAIFVLFAWKCRRSLIPVQLPPRANVNINPAFRLDIPESRPTSRSVGTGTTHQTAKTEPADHAEVTFPYQPPSQALIALQSLARHQRSDLEAINQKGREADDAHANLLQQATSLQKQLNEYPSDPLRWQLRHTTQEIAATERISERVAMDRRAAEEKLKETNAAIAAEQNRHQ